MKNLKRLMALLLVAVIMVSVVACGKGENKDANPTKEGAEAADKAQEDIAMQYISAEDLKAKADDYLILDVRKAEDFDKGHIANAVSQDMDAAKNGDTAAGEKTMKGAVEGNEKPVVLICYSGKAYAQAATNALGAIGYDTSKVYTLEGGMKAWEAAYPDDIEK